MFSRLLLITLASLLCGLVCPSSNAQGSTTVDPVEALATALAERMVADAENRPRVTVLDFTDIQNRQNELGRFLALQLANELVTLRNVAVLDRANLETIMAEHQLTAEGLLRPEDAKKLGQFAGVDAILIGNVSLMGDNVEVFVRAISTETSEILASGRARLSASDELRRMLGLRVDTRAAAGTSSGAPRGAGAFEGEAIAVREVGPITATLRNVAQHSTQIGRDTVPVIRCTFDMENRNLQRSVAIAANQRAKAATYRVDIDGYRGDLADSNQASWTLVEVRGISAVVCFEFGPQATRQQNPGAIVNYIRTARRHDGGAFTHGDRANYWAGSFSSIPPGETIRMTVDFVPAQVPGQRGRSGAAPLSKPEHFQFDMELVLATFVEGEEPAKARDLMLRNLTIDRVVLPE
ncbi:MAG TPA: FlgO family outer membrane protein [Phycisphaerales bacterium]|nr:FlgO family outer membrane protein [Phycisphaerales bacterium]